MNFIKLPTTEEIQAAIGTQVWVPKGHFNEQALKKLFADKLRSLDWESLIKVEPRRIDRCTTCGQRSALGCVCHIL